MKTISRERVPYLLNPADKESPLRYKQSQREHRANRDFTPLTKEEKFKKAGGKCERCKKSVSFDKAHFHHILSLSYAFHYFLQFTDEILKNEINCQFLCDCCHDAVHKLDSLEHYKQIALELTKKIEEVGLIVYDRRTKIKNKRKRVQHAMQETASSR